MVEPLPVVLARLRLLILDDRTLVRAVAAGRRRAEAPAWRRAELRYVDLDAGRHLQVTVYDEKKAYTVNHPLGASATAAVDELLEEPFANWHVDTVTASHQMRVTRDGEARLHTQTRPANAPAEVSRRHDRTKPRLLPEDDPVLRAIGISDGAGRVKPTKQAKYRQVEEFLRALTPSLDDAISSGLLHEPTIADPIRVADLGCGNAYLTFAAHRYLTAGRGLPVRLVGVDVKEESCRRNADIAASLGISDSMSFVNGEVASVTVEPPPEIVLALHLCDTATDDAVARAVEWKSPLILAAPCCHHDVAAQLRRATVPVPYALLTRHGILRERLADTMTDSLRAAILRQLGYRVDVIEFVESKHTPRNTLLRAVRTEAEPSAELRRDLELLTNAWGIEPRLAVLLNSRLS